MERMVLEFSCEGGEGRGEREERGEERRWERVEERGEGGGERRGGRREGEGGRVEEGEEVGERRQGGKRVSGRVEKNWRAARGGRECKVKPTTFETQHYDSYSSAQSLGCTHMYVLLSIKRKSLGSNCLYWPANIIRYNDSGTSPPPLPPSHHQGWNNRFKRYCTHTHTHTLSRGGAVRMILWWGRRWCTYIHRSLRPSLPPTDVR